VTVHIPAGLWAQIKDRTGSGGPTLKTNPVNLREYSPGQRLPVEARVIEQIGGFSVRVDNPVVPFLIEVAAKPDSDLETLQIKVNAQVQMPTKWLSDDTWEKFSLERDSRTPWENIPVTVRGPAADIAKLKQRLDEVKASLELSDHDKKNMETPWERAVILRFPPELKIEVVGESPKVWFFIRERKPA
jgi:hypothetical protein